MLDPLPPLPSFLIFSKFSKRGDTPFGDRGDTPFGDRGELSFDFLPLGDKMSLRLLSRGLLVFLRSRGEKEPKVKLFFLLIHSKNL